MATLSELQPKTSAGAQLAFFRLIAVEQSREQRAIELSTQRRRIPLENIRIQLPSRSIQVQAITHSPQLKSSGGWKRIAPSRCSWIGRHRRPQSRLPFLESDSWHPYLRPS